MATSNRTRAGMRKSTTSTSTQIRKATGEGGRELSDKALAMRKERLAKEEEQKKKMVYMIIGPGILLIIIVIIIKAFMGSGGDSSSPTRTTKKIYRPSQKIPAAAKPQMKIVMALVDESRSLIRTAATSEDSKKANELYGKATVKLEKARDMVSVLSDKHPGEWADPEFQRIQTLMYSSNKSTGFNYY